MTRDFVFFWLNGEAVEVRGVEVFLPLAEFLRKRRSLVGTKVVCSEGDCGACTILKATAQVSYKETAFLPINSCIVPVYLMDASAIVTIEGISCGPKLHPIQQSMVACQGQQCGFCTPGIVMSLVGLCEQKKEMNFSPKELKNSLTGNLCRCTGYLPIMEAGLALNQRAGSSELSVKEKYLSPTHFKALKSLQERPVLIEVGDKSFYSPTKLSQALSWIKKKSPVRIVSSATDLGVWANKGRENFTRFLGLNLVPELFQVKREKGQFIIGAKVNMHETSHALKKDYPEFSDFIHVFASPQIKNMATLVGNVANASPIADSIPFLCVAEAQVHIRGLRARKVNINSFFKGYRKTDLKKGELITAIGLPLLPPGTHCRLYKVSTRKDLDISTVNLAVTLKFEKGMIGQIKLAYGGVGPTVIRARETEEYLKGRPWEWESIKGAFTILEKEITPQSDLRGSKDFRILLAKNLLQKSLYDIQRN